MTHDNVAPAALSVGFRFNRRVLWVSLFALIIGAVAWGLFSVQHYPDLDNRLILERYIEQVRAGNGMVFNPGERTLLILAPAYILLAAPLSPGVVFVLSVMVGAVSLYGIAQRMAFRATTSLLVSLIYPLLWPIWAGMGTPFPPMAALCLVGLTFALYERWRFAGIMFAIAAMFSPEALIPGAAILLYAVQKGVGPRFGLPFFGLLALAVMGLYAYYGPTLWEGLLLLKRSQPLLSDVYSWAVLVVLIGLAVIGWYRERTKPEVALLGAWLMFYVLVIGGLLRVPLGWQYPPILGPALLLSAIALRRYLIIALVGAIGILVAIFLLTVMRAGAIQPPVYASLNPDRLRSTASLGALSAFDVSLLTNVPDKPLVAFDGELQPELKHMIERGDRRSVMIRYAPDLIFIRARDRESNELFDAYLLSLLGYHAEGNDVLVRTLSLGVFVDQARDLAFGPDIRLTAIALDQTEITSDGALRVRLDWQLARNASRPVTVTLWLNTPSGEIARIVDVVAPGLFRAGPWSTYHVLRATQFNADQPQDAELWLAVSINDGTIARYRIATLRAAPGPGGS